MSRGMAWTSSQKYLAEFLGTFALLLFGGGSAVTSLAAGSTIFGSPADVLARTILVSLCFGIVVLGGAYAFGSISGGHFNPAVTLSMAVNGRMPIKDVVPYLVAQIVGGIVGILVVAGIAYGNSGAWAIAVTHGFGSQCYVGNTSPCGYSIGSVFLLELALTFGFVLVIQRVTRPDSGTVNLAPIAIGLTLAITNLVAIPVDGASINPVRSFSPAVVTLLVGGSGAPSWPIDQVWIFWLAPIIGGLLAAAVDSWLRPVPEGGGAPAAPPA
jgi:aquaporin Z